MPDFSNCNWGDTFETVKKTEKMPFYVDGVLGNATITASPCNPYDEFGEMGYIIYRGNYLGRKSKFWYYFLDNKLVNVKIAIESNCRPYKHIKEFFIMARELKEIYGEPDDGNSDCPYSWLSDVDKKQYDTGKMVDWGKALEKGLVNFWCMWNNQDTQIQLWLHYSVNEAVDGIDMEIDYFGLEYIDRINAYYEKLVTRLEEKDSFINFEDRVEDLYSLSPREFEEYTQELLIRLGYENVILTPYVNDKGIDLFCEKDGKKIAVQCKKYKDKVGSPEIISFIGAMVNARADAGIFITTGTFTFEAEAIAAKNPIMLINKVKLAKIVIDLLDSPQCTSVDFI